MRKKRFLSLVLVLLMVVMIVACSNSEKTNVPKESEIEKEDVVSKSGKGNLLPGSYEAESVGMGGKVVTQVVVDENNIKEIKIVHHYETPNVGTVVIEKIPIEIIERQTLSIDAVTGATLTTNAILRSVEDCLNQAGADIDAYKSEEDRIIKEYPSELTADVIVVGGGGAGLSAAASAVGEGASVIVIEKTGILGGNTNVCGGIYNAPNPELQGPQGIEDSVELFVKQTLDIGDNVANPELVQTMCENSYEGLKWLESMGMKFSDKVFQGAGAPYPRTHQSLEPLGNGFINAYLRTLNASGAKSKILTETKGESLILDGDRIVGVNAINKDGSELILYANKGVVLATGGFAGNIELRQEYCEGDKWTDLGQSVPTTNMPGNTGDGIKMAIEIGADLVDMEHIQLTNLCQPKTGMLVGMYDLSTANSIFINQEGNRFVKEDGRRDDICKAIYEQPDDLYYMLHSGDTLPDPSKAKTGEGIPMDIVIENNMYGWQTGNTLEELATKIKVPAENLIATIEKYNAAVDSGKDNEFGRTLLTKKFEVGPWYAFPRVPSAHHTMGGVRIDSKTHVLNANEEIIKGLYAAGEVTGGIHGANRMGGNAVVDTVVFGRIAGSNAAKGE